MSTPLGVRYAIVDPSLLVPYSTRVFIGLVAYLTDAPGSPCTIPFPRIRELTRATLPDAAMSAAWWTDAAGWRASAASRACRSAGWRLQSVHAAAGLVRFVRTGHAPPVRGAPRGQRRPAPS